MVIGLASCGLGCQNCSFVDDLIFGEFIGERTVVVIKGPTHLTAINALNTEFNRGHWHVNGVTRDYRCNCRTGTGTSFT